MLATTPSPGYNYSVDELERRIYAEYRAGEPMADISDQFGLSSVTVMFIVRRQLQGEQRPWSQKTTEAMLTLVRDYTRYLDQALDVAESRLALGDHPVEGVQPLDR